MDEASVRPSRCNSAREAKATQLCPGSLHSIPQRHDASVAAYSSKWPLIQALHQHPVNGGMVQIRYRHRYPPHGSAPVSCRSSRFKDLCIIVFVWLNLVVSTIGKFDYKILFDIHRKVTALAIHKAINTSPRSTASSRTRTRSFTSISRNDLKGEVCSTGR